MNLARVHCTVHGTILWEGGTETDNSSSHFPILLRSPTYLRWKERREPSSTVVAWSQEFARHEGGSE